MKISTKIKKIEDILQVHLCQCACGELRDTLEALKKQEYFENGGTVDDLPKKGNEKK